jgi:hypothetical protein
MRKKDNSIYVVNYLMASVDEYWKMVEKNIGRFISGNEDVVVYKEDGEKKKSVKFLIISDRNLVDLLYRYTISKVLWANDVTRRGWAYRVVEKGMRESVYAVFCRFASHNFRDIPIKIEGGVSFYKYFGPTQIYGVVKEIVAPWNYSSDKFYGCVVSLGSDGEKIFHSAIESQGRNYVDDRKVLDAVFQARRISMTASSFSLDYYNVKEGGYDIREVGFESEIFVEVLRYLLRRIDREELLGEGRNV